MNTLMRRRGMMAGKSKDIGLIYFGDTPKMTGSNNQTISNLCEFPQPSGAVYNYILFLSKDRRAYKQIAYTQDTLTGQVFGKIRFDATPYTSYSSDSERLSFRLMNRESNASIIVGHGRMTTKTGAFYVYYSQAFEVYGLMGPYEEGSIN